LPENKTNKGQRDQIWKENSVQIVVGSKYHGEEPMGRENTASKGEYETFCFHRIIPRMCLFSREPINQAGFGEEKKDKYR